MLNRLPLFRAGIGMAGQMMSAAMMMALSAAAPWAESSGAESSGNEPLSAIDWLSKPVTATTRPAGTSSVAPERLNEPPVVKGGALPEDVATTPLDGPSPDAIGLIPPRISGLPLDLWGAGRAEEIAREILATRTDNLPAMRQLLLTMLQAETRPVADSGGRGILLQARIDKLILIGALEQAAALIEIADINTPEMFRRAFDVALLTGNESRACAAMRKAPGLSPRLQARVFCLVREGQWDASALTLTMAEALGEISTPEADLLARFLDPTIGEEEPPPPPPKPLTPLDWKIYEAIGEPIPTTELPVAFAYAENSPHIGWKAQIEAAERLTRAGTIAPNVILGLYTSHAPAASGGVWDRVAAFQAFDKAMQANDVDAIARTLPDVWARMKEVDLEVPFAALYGAELAGIPLDGEAGGIALRVTLLSPSVEHLAAEIPAPNSAEDAFLVALAQGRLDESVAPNSVGRIIASAFLAPEPPESGTRLINENRRGEAILVAMNEMERGAEGDVNGISRGIALLLELGLDDVARRAALQLMILDRRG